MLRFGTMVPYDECNELWNFDVRRSRCLVKILLKSLVQLYSCLVRFLFIFNFNFILLYLFIFIVLFFIEWCRRDSILCLSVHSASMSAFVIIC